MLTGSGIIALYLLIGLAAALLALVGLIGREVRTPPMCVRCRFDLSGHEDARRGRFPVTCPECGLVILHDAQITRTRRERKRAALRTGVAGLILSVGAIVSVAVATGGSLDVYRLLSTDRLLALAEGGSPEAFEALSVRVSEARLTNPQWDRVTRNAIDELTGDRPAPDLNRGVLSYWDGWDRTSWSSFYPVLIRTGRIDRATAAEHAARLVTAQLSLPDDLSVGRPMPFRVEANFRRDPSSNSWSSTSGVDARVVGVRLDGRPLLDPESSLPAVDEGRHSSDHRGIEVDWTWEGTDRLPIIDDVEPGEHTVEVTVRMTSLFSIGGGDAVLTNLVNANSPLPWLDVTVSRTVTVGPDRSIAALPAEWHPESGVEASLSRKCDCGRAPGVRLRLAQSPDVNEDAVAFVDVYVDVGGGDPWYLGNNRIRVSDSSWTEFVLTEDQAAAIDARGHAELRVVPTPWNADLYFERPAQVLSGADVQRPVRFEDDDE
jgi:hypothetical protein